MRAKWTRIRANFQEIQQLSGECDQDHIHLGWGKDNQNKFVSSQEACCPPEMCKAVIQVIRDVLVQRGYFFDNKSAQLTLESEDTHKRRRATGGKQPRGNKLPPLISEFKEIKSITRKQALDLEAKIIRPHSSLAILHGGEQEAEWAGVVDVLSETTEYKEHVAELDENTSMDDMVIAGIFRSPEEFLTEALKLKHPADMQGGIPDELLSSKF